jgi:hypothetical protein
VDNLWIKLDLSTGRFEFGLIHRFSTGYPHLVHRVIHRVIHSFERGADLELTGLK